MSTGCCASGACETTTNPSTFPDCEAGYSATDVFNGYTYQNMFTPSVDLAGKAIMNVQTLFQNPMWIGTGPFCHVGPSDCSTYTDYADGQPHPDYSWTGITTDNTTTQACRFFGTKPECTTGTGQLCGKARPELSCPGLYLNPTFTPQAGGSQTCSYTQIPSSQAATQLLMDMQTFPEPCHKQPLFPQDLGHKLLGDYCTQIIKCPPAPPPPSPLFTWKQDSLSRSFINDQWSNKVVPTLLFTYPCPQNNDLGAFNTWATKQWATDRGISAQNLLKGQSQGSITVWVVPPPLFSSAHVNFDYQPSKDDPFQQCLTNGLWYMFNPANQSPLVPGIYAESTTSTKYTDYQKFECLALATFFDPAFRDAIAGSNLYNQTPGGNPYVVNNLLKSVGNVPVGTYVLNTPTTPSSPSCVPDAFGNQPTQAVRWLVSGKDTGSDVCANWAQAFPEKSDQAKTAYCNQNPGDPACDCLQPTQFVGPNASWRKALFGSTAPLGPGVNANSPCVYRACDPTDIYALTTQDQIKQSESCPSVCQININATEIGGNVYVENNAFVQNCNFINQGASKCPNGTCPSGQSCVNDGTNPAFCANTCKTSADCPSVQGNASQSQICSNGVCVYPNQCIPGDSTHACPKGQTCGTGNPAFCTSECTQNSDCVSPAFCAGGSCSLPSTECSSTNPCPTGQICLNGACVNVQCADNSQCQSWQTCQNGLCVSQTCNTDQDCPTGTQCNTHSNICVALNCQKDTDCDTEYQCVQGKCQKAQEPTTNTEWMVWVLYSVGAVLLVLLSISVFSGKAWSWISTLVVGVLGGSFLTWYLVSPKHNQ